MELTELTLSIDGEHPAPKATDLCNWLHEGRLSGIKDVYQQQTPPKPGEQGPTLLAVLTVVLSSQAVIEMAKSVHRYIEARKPIFKITVKSGEETIVIDCVNPPPLAELVAEFKKLVEALKG